jgi:ABC-type multidrug transport system ATPase subunit
MRVKKLYFQHHQQAPYFFKDLSFDLEPGLIHALHGKNGIGKSVLLNILSKRIEKEAVMTGEVIADKAVLVNQQFDQTLAPQFTFLENLQFGSLSRFPSPFARLKTPDTFTEIVERFHIDASLPVHKLSGGQRQILALLVKLQHKANILLLDEPTATLDEHNAIMVFEFLKSLKEMTMLVVCHDQNLVNHYTTGQHLYLETDTQGVRYLK